MCVIFSEYILIFFFPLFFIFIEKKVLSPQREREALSSVSETRGERDEGEATKRRRRTGA